MWLKHFINSSLLAIAKAERKQRLIKNNSVMLLKTALTFLAS